MLPTNFNSILELMEYFKTEQDCIDHLEYLRWEGNVVSPFDKESKVYKCKNNKYKCKNSGKYFNVKTNTLFDSSNISLRKWFLAIWLITSHKKGISSVQLSKDLGITQKSSWFLLQRIRNCFGIENKGELKDEVEADETFVGGKNKNRHKDKKVKNSQGRSFKDKVPVSGILQREKHILIKRKHKINPEKEVIDKIVTNPAKIIAKVTQDTKSKTLQPFIMDHVKKDSMLLTDEWHGYTGCEKRYNHQFIDHGKRQYVDKDNPHIHTNTIEGSWKILKNSVRDMYNRVSKKHLQKYVDEFVFRYNTKHLNEGNRFDLLLKNCNFRLTYKTLVYG